MVTKRHVVQFREFLNLVEDGGSAYVKFTVTRTSKRVSASFTIKDCNNEASLDFYWSDGKLPENELYKLEMLKRAVLEFEEAYLSAIEIRMKKLKQNKKRAKARKAATR